MPLSLNVPQHELRSVSESDVPVLFDLVRQLATFERLEDHVVATPEDLHKGLFGAKAIAQAVIAWSSDTAIGFALWYETFSTFRGRKGIYLEDLFVVPQHRGKGVGLSLFRHVARIALDRGCFRLEWEVLRWNERAIRFYQELGGERNADWDVYTLTDDALVSAARDRI